MTVKFKIGDQVKYVSREFGDGDHNPRWGGICGHIKGIVDNVKENYDTWAHTKEKGYFGVLWDNGNHNCYAACDLALCREGICPECGEDYAVHNDDGTCAEKNS